VTVGAKWMSGWYRVSQKSGWIPKKWKTIFSYREISQKLCTKQNCQKAWLCRPLPVKLSHQWPFSSQSSVTFRG